MNTDRKLGKLGAIFVSFMPKSCLTVICKVIQDQMVKTPVIFLGEDAWHDYQQGSNGPRTRERFHTLIKL